jgi:hypothetical protein
MDFSLIYCSAFRQVLKDLSKLVQIAVGSGFSTPFEYFEVKMIHTIWLKSSMGVATRCNRAAARAVIKRSNNINTNKN